jgi:16S rRNA processing protein RimM
MSAAGLSRQPDRSKEPAGSPNEGEPVFLVVAKLRRPHGLRGEMLADVMTDFPERLIAGYNVFVGEDHRLERIRSIRMHGKSILLKFENYNDPESIGIYRNHLVYVRADELPALPEGELYQHQILGLRVVSDDGLNIGRLESILETGANDVLIVRQATGGEILLPVIDDVILDIDLDAGEIRVHLTPGLLPE